MIRKQTNYGNFYPSQLDGVVVSTTSTDDVNILIPPSNERVSYDTSAQDHVYTNNVSGEEGGNDDCVYSNNDDITKYDPTSLSKFRYILYNNLLFEQYTWSY
jgi:hypothetical protein